MPESEALLRSAGVEREPNLAALTEERKAGCCIACDWPLSGNQRFTCSPECRDTYLRAKWLDYRHQATALRWLLINLVYAHPSLRSLLA